MKRIGTAAILTLVIGWLCVPSAATAQGSSGLRNPNVLFEYYEPRNQAFLQQSKRLENRRVLENLSEFLAPVKWPTKLRLMMKECPAAGIPSPQVFYTKTDRSLTICYQWFGPLQTIAKRTPSAFASPQEIVVGGLVGMVLHAAARATIDILNVPVLGSEVDAADQIAAFTALRFGDQAARAVIKGTYRVWKHYDDEFITSRRPYDFASSSGIPRQRMYTTLCIAYGGAPKLFQNFVDSGDLLSGRVENCEAEFRQAGEAFHKTIVKKVDEGLMKKVLSLTWLSADDLR
jgi:hypothetical protein